MSQTQPSDPGDRETKINIKLNADDEKYARAVRLASYSLDLSSVRNSAAAKRDVMQQLSIVESHYFYKDETALSKVSSITNHSKLVLIPIFRQAASVGQRVQVDERFKMKFKPTKMVLYRRDS